MVLDMLVDLQTCIDVSAGRADCNMNVLILVGIEEVLNLVSGGTTLASPPVEGNTDFSGNDKLILYLLLSDKWYKSGGLPVYDDFVKLIVGHFFGHIFLYRYYRVWSLVRAYQAITSVRESAAICPSFTTTTILAGLKSEFSDPDYIFVFYFVTNGKHGMRLDIKRFPLNTVRKTDLSFCYSRHANEISDRGTLYSCKNFEGFHLLSVFIGC